MHEINTTLAGQTIQRAAEIRFRWRRWAAHDRGPRSRRLRRRLELVEGHSPARWPEASTWSRCRIPCHRLPMMSAQRGGPSTWRPARWSWLVIPGAARSFPRRVRNDKVKALVYVAAFALPKGQSVNSAGAGAPPQPWQGHSCSDAEGYVRLPAEAVGRYLRRISRRPRSRYSRQRRVRPFPERSTTGSLKRPMRRRPSWYIIATHDGMIPPAVQEAMAADIGARVTRIEGSHVVMLSKPQQVADVILEAAAEVAVSPQTKMPSRPMESLASTAD